MAAHAERASGEFWQPVPDLRPVEGTRERDAGPEPLLVGRGTRRVVAAEAHAPDRDSFSIEIIALFDPIHDCARRALVRSEEHTSELQSPCNIVCRLLLEKKKHHTAGAIFTLSSPTPSIPATSSSPGFTAPTPAGGPLTLTSPCPIAVCSAKVARRPRTYQ